MELKENIIALGCDHAGYTLKEKIKNVLIGKGVEVIDFGTYGTESVDYPDYMHELAVAVSNGKSKFGIAICGSGNGVNITVNKHQDIRCALCWNTELARLARQHNDANVLALASRFVDHDVCLECVDVFLNTSFEGGRHKKRVDKIKCK